MKKPETKKVDRVVWHNDALYCLLYEIINQFGETPGLPLYWDIDMKMLLGDALAFPTPKPTKVPRKPPKRK